MPAPQFIIGPFKQPKRSAGFWRDWGANTLFFWEEERNSAKVPTVSQTDWRAAVASAGLNYIDQPLAGSGATPTQLEENDPHLIAFGQPDESDRQLIANEVFMARYNAMKIGNNKPVYANFDGHQMDNPAYDGRKRRSDKPIDRPFWHSASDLGYLAGCDFGGFDYYLSPQRWGLWEILERLYDRYQWWGNNRPCVITLATGQNKGYTWQRVRATLMHDLSYCARIGLPVKGIMLFPQKSEGPFAYDDSSFQTKAALKGLFADMLGVAADYVDPTPAPVPSSDEVLKLKADLNSANAKLASMRTVSKSIADAASELAKI